jgi:hypothetical protein
LYSECINCSILGVNERIRVGGEWFVETFASLKLNKILGFCVVTFVRNFVFIVCC